MNPEEDQEKWFNLLAAARVIASEDLKSSNDLLEIADQLLESINENLDQDQKIKIIGQLIEISSRLTQRSKFMSTSIAKLVGAL